MVSMVVAGTTADDSDTEHFARQWPGLYGPGRFLWREPIMPQSRPNPSKLNQLQLRTLTLLQAIAKIPGASNPTADGNTAITQFPHAHGDHFHLGDAVVRASDATGLENQNVWSALARKGLIKCEWPHEIALTPDGAAYDTGIADQILHMDSHH
jgi:hypothetical protein